MNEREVTQIIESNRPLIGLMGQIGNGLDVLKFFGDRMAQRFSSTAVGAQCCCCQKKPVSGVQVFYWRALTNPQFAFTRTDALLLFVGRLGVNLRQTIVEFATFHGLCLSCASKIKRNRLFSVIVKSISFFLLLVCLMITVFSGGGAVMFWTDEKDRHSWLIGLFVGVIGLIASIFGHIWERNLSVPKFSATIGRKPFYLEKVMDGNSKSS